MPSARDIIFFCDTFFCWRLILVSYLTLMQMFAREDEGLLGIFIQSPYPSDAPGFAISQGEVNWGQNHIIQDSKQSLLHSLSWGIWCKDWRVIIGICAENKSSFLKLFFSQWHLQTSSPTPPQMLLGVFRKIIFHSVKNWGVLNDSPFLASRFLRSQRCKWL